MGKTRTLGMTGLLIERMVNDRGLVLERIGDDGLMPTNGVVV